MKKIGSYLKNNLLLVVFIGFFIGILIMLLFYKTLKITSTNESCEVCHVHPHVFDSWKLSDHHDTRVGMHIGCVDCHLPPEGEGYLVEKMKASARDLYGFVFKDSADYKWELKSTLENAKKQTFKES